MIEQSIIPGIQSVMLERLLLDPALQPRRDMDPALIAEYAERMDAGDEFPPVVAYLDTDSVCWLSQGWHRFAAAREAGYECITVEIREGSRRDALWDSLGSNKDHGLRRSNADKARAVRTVLADADWSRKSAAAIARHVGVAVDTVTKYLAERETLSLEILKIASRESSTEALGSIQDAPPLTDPPLLIRLVERNGTQYEMDVSRIGSAPKPTFTEMLVAAGADDDPGLQRAKRAQALSVVMARICEGIASLTELEQTMTEIDRADHERIYGYVRQLQAFAARLEAMLNSQRNLRLMEGGQHG